MRRVEGDLEGDEVDGGGEKPHVRAQGAEYRCELGEQVLLEDMGWLEQGEYGVGCV